jgi:phosphoribosylanthranilate isomerase
MRDSTMDATPRVKICCICSLEEAWTAINHEASALGLVSEMPSGPGVIPESLITNIAGRIPPFVSSVLLTSKRAPSEIIEQHRRCGTNAIQICDDLDPDGLDEVGSALPGIDLIKVIHVHGEGSIEEAEAVSLHVDGILLDSGSKGGSVVELGGTGRTHNWEISRRIVEAVDVPVILAGGLNPENVAEAIKLVKPYAVDVCSGVRTGGSLDPDKLQSFMTRVRGSAK